MKIHKNIKNNNKIILLVVIAGVLLASYVIFGYATQSFPFQKNSMSNEDGASSNEPRENDINYSMPTDDQKSTGDDAKQDFIDKNYGDSETQSPAASIGITSISGDSASKVSIRATVETSEPQGLCKVLATGPSGTVELSAELQGMGSYSVCKGFDMDLGKGKWDIKIQYQDTQGNISKDQKEYEVK